MTKKSKRPKNTVTRLACIVGARVGITVVTSSFASGDVGPMFVSVAPGCLSQKEFQALSLEFEGLAVLCESATGSHFMNSESTWIMMETLLTDAFRKQREKYSLHSRKGMILADAFSGNHGSAYMLLREKWSTTANVLLPSKQPGGWSAHGQPQDRLRQLCSHRLCLLIFFFAFRATLGQLSQLIS